MKVAARALLAVFLFSLASAAEQSIVLGKTGTYSNSSTSTVTEFRLEMRLHGCSTGGTWAVLWSAFDGAAYVRLNGTDLVVHDWRDDGGSGTAISRSISGRTDFLVRYQRSAANSKIYLELWDVDGTDQSSASVNITTLSNTWPRSQAAGDATQNTCSVAWVRYYNTLATYPGASAPPLSDTGTLADYELEGDGAESVNGWDLTLSGSPVFVTTPVYDPSAIISGPTTVRATEATAYDGSGSATFRAPLTYAWTKISGTGTVVFSAPTSAATNATFPSRDEYVIRLTVDDGTATAYQDYTVGSVVTDDNYVVTLADASVSKVIGPLLMFGKAPWTYFDNRHKTLADAFGGWLTSDPADFGDDWNTAHAGTITVTNASTSVVGVATTFKADYCNGTTSPYNSQPLVVWYSLGGGLYGRRPADIASCVDDTHITLSAIWRGATESGLQHSTMGCLGCWISGATNANYYDNVMAYYALYYRTGLTAYRTYARTLADRWWSMPSIDGFRCWNNNTGDPQYNYCVGAPRIYALTGLMLRTLDGGGDLWPGIEDFVAWAGPHIGLTGEIGDLREDGYYVYYVALTSLLDPDAGKRATFAAYLEDAIDNKWGPQQKITGEWTNPTYGYATWNGYSGTVTVTHGSTTVSGSGTSFPAGMCTGNYFWVATVDGSTGDPVAYTCTWVSGTQLTLDRPYEGTTASAKGWQANNLVGRGTQPFMMGVVGQAWWMAYQALTAAGSPYASTARRFVIDAATWLSSTGWDATGKGMFYGRGYPNCEPTPASVPNCASDRFLNSEALNAITRAYGFTTDAAFSTQGDKMFGATWGGPSSVGPYADGMWTQTYDDGGWTLASKKSKDFGFAWGIGNGSAWPAARLQAAAPATRSISGSVSISGALIFQ